MRSVPHAKNSVLSIGLLLAFGCPTIADGNVVTKLKSLAAKCENNDSGNLIAVDFGFHPLATGDDLALLNGLDSVSDVSIAGMDLGSDGFKHFASLSKLKRLDASGAKCTDADIRHLAGLQSLQELALSDNAITDASVPTLAKLESLRWINLSSTRVTPEGLSRLRRALPKLHVQESWNYFAGYVRGRVVLDMDRATIVFNYMHAPESSNGGGGGGSVQVSKSAEDEKDFAESGSSGSGGGFVIGRSSSASIYTSIVRTNGIPTIRVGKHRIEIKGEGTELIIDGQAFSIGREKLRIVVDGDGIATLDK